MWAQVCCALIVILKCALFPISVSDQSNSTVQRGIYQISLVRKIRNSMTRRVLVSEPEYFTPLALTMPNNIIKFKYVMFKGNYKVQFRFCLFKGENSNSSAATRGESGDFRNCGVGTDDVTTYNDVTESRTVSVNKNYPLKSWCLPTSARSRFVLTFLWRKKS